jgi:hypothetical protein
MTFFARIASILAFGLIPLAAQAQTQRSQSTGATGAADQSQFYADFTLGATFGHQSSGSVGAEAGVHVADNLDVFFEGGHMKNVGTQDLDNRAQVIGNAVGATVSTAYKVNYFDVGVRYHLPVSPKPVFNHSYVPYAVLGVGAAPVRSETALSVNGTTVPPESLGVQFGNDLNGTVTKAIIVLGIGATTPFARRYFADLSFRYGRILARTGQIENDKGINTARLQIAVGVRF